MISSPLLKFTYLEQVRITGKYLSEALIFHQLTHYMTTDCSFTLPKNDLLSHLNWGAQVLMEISSNV